MTIQQRYVGPGGRAEDRYWMRRALALARRGVGATSPNPPVGAVVVKNQCLLAEGFHRRAGDPHAEVVALSGLLRPADADGATLYVTLEPCSTHGRTPPCTEAILGSGIGRVVFGSVDPRPAHAGEAVVILQGQGLAVEVGVLREDADDLIRIFRHWIRKGRPYVIAKAGISLDGCVTRPAGESQWLTSREARRDAQRLRVLVDAVVVGAETVRCDNPKLTVRHPDVPDFKRPPRRVILTRSGRLPPDAHVFTDEDASRTKVVRDARWPDWLEDLAGEGVTSVLLEGGGKTLTEALQASAIQEMHLYLAPLVSGSGRRLIPELLGEPRSVPSVRYDLLGDQVKISIRFDHGD